MNVLGLLHCTSFRADSLLCQALRYRTLPPNHLASRDNLLFTLCLTTLTSLIPLPRMSSEREKTMEEIIQDVRCFYHRGAPLFTRDELRRVADLIDKHAKGELENDKMLAKGINDAAVRVFPRGDGSYRKPKYARNHSPWHCPTSTDGTSLYPYP